MAPDERKRVNDAVHTRAIRETGIDVGLAFIHATADGRDDAFDDGHDRVIVHERLVRELKFAVTFDKNPLGSIDHDFGDGVVGEELLKRAEAEGFVEDFGADLIGMNRRRELAADFGDDRGDDFAGAATEFVGIDVGGGEPFDIEPFN